MPASELIAVLVIAGLVIFAIWKILAGVFHLRKLEIFGSFIKSKLTPGEQYTIAVTNDTVEYEHPDGTVDSIKWAGLRRVEILTTDEGPFLPDSLLGSDWR